MPKRIGNRTIGLIRQLHNDNHWGSWKIAKKLGVSRSTACKYLKTSKPLESQEEKDAVL